MSAFFKYISYMARHKWFVFVECFKWGIPFRGLFHDTSKFMLDEWIAYQRYFYGKETETSEAEFNKAWLKHQHRNKHHWQHWILRMDDGSTEVLPIPWEVCMEMVCDWKGAGKAVGMPDTIDWYEKNKEKMILHPRTRNMVEFLLEQE